MNAMSQFSFMFCAELSVTALALVLALVCRWAGPSAQRDGATHRTRVDRIHEPA